MNIGSLYQVKKRFWLLFPTKEMATHSSVVADADAVWYAARINCNVTYFSPDSFVVCLEEDGNLKKFLTSEGLIGWIRFGEHESYFKEVKSE
jgi:hypothetical protein